MKSIIFVNFVLVEFSFFYIFQWFQEKELILIEVEITSEIIIKTKGKINLLFFVDFTFGRFHLR